MTTPRMPNITVTQDPLTGDFIAALNEPVLPYRESRYQLHSAVTFLIDTNVLAKPTWQLPNDGPIAFRLRDDATGTFEFLALTEQRPSDALKALISGAMAGWYNTPRAIIMAHPDPRVTAVWSEACLPGWTAGSWHGFSAAWEKLGNFAREHLVHMIRLIVVGNLSYSDASDDISGSITLTQQAVSFGFHCPIIGVSDDPEFRERMVAAGCTAAVPEAAAAFYLRGYIHML